MRSMSGTGTVRGVPKSSAEEISLGRWSTVLAEKMLRVPRALMSGLRYSCPARLWTLGFPT